MNIKLSSGQILKYFFRLRNLNENTIVKQAFILSEKLWEKGHKTRYSESNVGKSNSIELNPWIEFDWIR